jgi:hypothetical protein
MRPEKGDNDLARSAPMASQPFTCAHEWKIIAEMRSQFHEGQPGGVFALAAVGAVVVRVIDVCERVGFELGVLHTPTLAPVGCALLVYNLYSVQGIPTLYNAREHPSYDLVSACTRGGGCCRQAKRQRQVGSYFPVGDAVCSRRASALSPIFRLSISPPK